MELRGIGRAALLMAAAAVWAVFADGSAGKPSNSALTKFIPAGYRFFEEVRGDLNGDGADDYVLIIKATDKKNIERDDNSGESLDRNRRGIMILFSNGDDYRLVLENRKCFSSENEDGGNYVPPDLVFGIKKGNLYIHYAHGRKGYWIYTFRYRNSEFELIGYDAAGSYSREEISINFLTKRQLLKICNKDWDDNCADCCSGYKETWYDITIKEPIALRKIVDFDKIHIDSYISKK